ncbi:hypothetical protein [Agromyces sp. NPDC058064]|uniref:hypothetical protein n=1 Tax=Agromyces sp. NPDC058064 TaxID=3346322 RepID=UPI0036D87E5E
MDLTTNPVPVFATSAAAAEQIDALRGRLLARLAAMPAAIGLFARRRRRDPAAREAVALELENRRIAAELRADSLRRTGAARLL